MSKALLAHPGTQYAPKLAAELAAHNLLYRYWTGVGFAAEGIGARLHAVAPARLRRALDSRRLAGVTAERLRTRPILDLQAWWRVRKGESAEDVLFDRNRRFQNAIPDRELVAAGVVIGFDTSSWILAERCRRLGRPFLLDQSIGHPRAKEAIYAEIAERYPGWSDQVKPKKASLVELEEMEHALATRVVTASTFSMETLIETGCRLKR